MLQQLLDRLPGRSDDEVRPTLRNEMIRFMLQSSWTWQSIQAVWQDLPRWERRLRAREVHSIAPLGERVWSYERSRGHNEMVLLMKQSQRDRDAVTEHRQRNLTGVRNFKA